MGKLVSKKSFIALKVAIRLFSLASFGKAKLLNNQTTLYQIDLITNEVTQSELAFLVESFLVLPNDSAVILNQRFRNDSQVKRITWL